MFKKVQIAHKEYTTTLAWADAWEKVMAVRFVDGKRLRMSTATIAEVRKLYATSNANVTNPKGLCSAMARALQCNNEYVRPVGTVLYQRKPVVQETVPVAVVAPPVLGVDVVKAELHLIECEIGKLTPRLSTLHSQKHLLESIIKRMGGAL